MARAEVTKKTTGPPPIPPQALPPYPEGAWTCAKCRHTTFHRTFCDGTQDANGLPCKLPVPVAGEHLHLHCGGCRFTVATQIAAPLPPRMSFTRRRGDE